MLALLFVLTACGGDGAGEAPGGTGSGTGAGQGGMQNDAVGTGASMDRMELTLSGPPMAGTHQAEGDMACFAQPGFWGAGLSRPGDPGISEFMLLLSDVPITGGSSDQMEFTVAFGDVMADETGESSALVGISGAAGGGSGTATVTRQGGGATIEVDGTSNHGTAIAAVIRCARVEVIQ